MKNLSQAEEVDEIRTLVRNSGLRSTAARITVIQFLRQATSPLTHAEIAEDLTPMGFDKATVYRNLIDLAEAGLVKRTELGDHAWRFELHIRMKQRMQSTRILSAPSVVVSPACTMSSSRHLKTSNGLRSVR